MDKKTLTAIVLSFAVFLGWQEFYMKKRAPQTVATTTTGSQTVATAQQRPTGQANPQTVSVRLEESSLSLSNGSKLISNWILNNYRTGLKADAKEIELNQVSEEAGNLEAVFDEASGLGYLSTRPATVTSQSPNQITLSYEDENIRWVREVSKRPQGDSLDLVLRATFKKAKPSYLFVSLTGQSPAGDVEAQDRQLFYWTEKSLERIHLSKDISFTQVSTPVSYIGLANRYFILSVLNRSMVEARGLVQPVGQHAGRVSLAYPITQNEMVVSLQIYFGPKKIGLLKAIDATLDPVVDFGWFTAIAYPLLKGLNFLYSFARNYGVAIILLTILLKILTFPLTYKSMKSMRQMAKIQPEIQKLREKYKDDPQTLNMQMMQLMRSGGYNPLAGCLPILIQMPVFFALYRVLYGAIELYHAPFMGWIHDLSSRDPLYVTPVLLTITMFFQQKLTPSTATDPVQAKMLQWMPVIFGVFMLSLPSGLTLYMLTNAVTSIFQQIILNRKLGIAPTPALKA